MHSIRSRRLIYKIPTLDCAVVVIILRVNARRLALSHALDASVFPPRTVASARGLLVDANLMDFGRILWAGIMEG